MKQSNNTWAKVVALVKTQCANYDTATGDCWALDCPCPQIASPLTFRVHGKLVCRYLAENVLPLDKLLQATIEGGVELKRCTICGKPMEAAGNRAKYCPECRKKERRKQQAKFEREKYARQRG